MKDVGIDRGRLKDVEDWDMVVCFWTMNYTLIGTLGHVLVGTLCPTHPFWKKSLMGVWEKLLDSDEAIRGLLQPAALAVTLTLALLGPSGHNIAS